MGDLNAIGSETIVSVPNNITKISLKKAKLPPSIDGDLDDPAWKDSTTITGFKRYKVKEGSPPSEKTEVRITYDSDNLYFGVRCFDKNPAKIRANISRRENIEGDDNVRFYLDTFSSKSRGYYFSVNPYGIQADGYLNEETEDPNRDFVYRSKGKIDKDGWTQEIAIPFKSLRFKSSDLQKWGLLITRYIAEKDEYISWPPLSRKIMGTLSQAGTIELERIKRGWGLDIIPYGAGGYNWTEIEGAKIGEKVINFGGDFRWGITSNLSLNLTYNPDFGHIESDTNQISLNRRTEVYYPEKRPFFLEGSDIFESPVNMLYTRRIINPLFGGKISGQVGRLGTQIFSVYDRGKEDNAAAVYNLGRFKLDLYPQSYVGTTIIDKEEVEEETSGFYNRVVSLDTSLKFLKYYRFTAQAALSWARNQEIHGDVPSYYASILRNDGSLFLNLIYEDFAPNFTNEAAFLNLDYQLKKYGIRAGSLTAKYTFRPENSWLKNWYISSFNSVCFDYKDSLQDKVNALEFSFNFEKNISFRITGYHQTEKFRDKSYQNLLLISALNINSSKYLSIFLGINYLGTGLKYDLGYIADPTDTDDSYQGWKASYGAKAQIKPLKRLNFELSFDNERFYEHAGGPLVYSALVGGLKTNLQFTREFLFKSFAQVDTQYQKIDINTLLGYMIDPGTVLYLGYNETISDFSDPTSINRSIFAKAAYMLSL